MEIVNTKNYFTRYSQILARCNTCYEAYCNLEEEYFDRYGTHKYTNYNAFVNAKTKYVTKKWVSKRG